MLDSAVFAQKVFERRKAQGLTQEQLGAEIGVSGQSVSKWENGETLPDLSLIPALCQVLGISADTLLGVDCNIGIDNLGKELAQRIQEMKGDNQANTLLQALKRLMLLGRAEPALKKPVELHKNTIDCHWKSGSLFRINLLKTKGLACFAMEGLLQADGPAPEVLAKVRLLLEPTVWEIAMQLLRGPQKTQALVAADHGRPGEEVQAALARMIEAGLIMQDREGYKLEPQNGLVWAAFIKAICMESGARTGNSIFCNHIP